MGPLVAIFLLTLPGILAFTVHLLFFQHLPVPRVLGLWHHLLILPRLANTSALQRMHSLGQMMECISARPQFQAPPSQLIHCTHRESKQPWTYPQCQGEKGEKIAVAKGSSVLLSLLWRAHRYFAPVLFLLQITSQCYCYKSLKDGSKDKDLPC